MKFLAVAALIPLVLSTGCASIVTGSKQIVAVTTVDKKGSDVQEAMCQLENPSGSYFVKTPGSTTVQRSYEDLVVTCKKPDVGTGVASVTSTTKGMAYGNILVGGFIGAAVDASTGAAYDYPSTITVIMGDNIRIGAPPAAPASPTGTEENPAQ